MIHQFDHRWATMSGMEIAADVTPATREKYADRPLRAAPLDIGLSEAEVTSRLVAKGGQRRWLIRLEGLRPRQTSGR